MGFFYYVYINLRKDLILEGFVWFDFYIFFSFSEFCGKGIVLIFFFRVCLNVFYIYICKY